MKLRTSLYIFTIALLCGGCSEALTQASDGVDSVSESIESGITGTVLLGPMTPVQSSADPTGAFVPFETDVSVFTMDGDLVTSVETNEAGEFEVAVDAGEYRLVPTTLQEGGLEHERFPRAEPVQVTVEEGVLVQTTIIVDTGIR